MSSLVSQLIQVIKKEIVCLERFLTLLSEEQRALVENDVDSLQKSIEDQEKTIWDARKLEEDRINLTDRLAEKLKIDKDQVNISKLTELVEESYATKLRELQSTLSSLYAKLERQRKKNEFLIKQSMRCVDQSIKVFLDLNKKTKDYCISEQKNEKVLTGEMTIQMV